jgi:hypothetical protein
VHLRLAKVLLEVVLVAGDKLEEMRVLVLDVGELVGHLALQQQVAQVAFLEKPPVEITEGALAVSQR